MIPPRWAAGKIQVRGLFLDLHLLYGRLLGCIARQGHFQDTVAELRSDLVLHHIRGHTKAALEAAVAAVLSG
jgi:hypothetical protein